jgi:hypothetical protein
MRWSRELARVAQAGEPELGHPRTALAEYVPEPKGLRVNFRWLDNLA